MGRLRETLLYHYPLMCTRAYVCVCTGWARLGWGQPEYDYITRMFSAPALPSAMGGWEDAVRRRRGHGWASIGPAEQQARRGEGN